MKTQIDTKKYERLPHHVQVAINHKERMERMRELASRDAGFDIPDGYGCSNIKKYESPIGSNPFMEFKEEKDD